MASGKADGEALCTELKADLAKWREALAAIEDGAGFDQPRSMLSSWIKEGQRLIDRIESELRG